MNVLNKIINQREKYRIHGDKPAAEREQFTIAHQRQAYQTG
jgi:hypothetical protein